MTRRAVDASVAVKWVVPEAHSPAALSLLSPTHRLAAPDLLYVESANVFWKRVRRGIMTPDEARVAITSLTSFPLVIHPSTSLVAAALEIAVQAGRTAYDSLYLALAVAEGCPLVTADERLFNSLQGSLLAPHVRWVADAGI